MYTVDASVWVNSFDQREEGHELSRQVLGLLRIQARAIIVPHLVLVEVAGAVSRTRQDPEKAREFATLLRSLPNVHFVPLDEVLTQRAVRLAAQHGLRGADAIYAAVAVQSNCTLITLDRDHLNRVTGIVTTCTPAEALTALVPEPPPADRPRSPE